MVVDRVVVSSGQPVTPEAVGSRTFSTVRRGFQPDEVRRFLARVADELASAAAREAELRGALQDALERAAHPAISEDVLTSGLGEHTARLIGAARETAAAITTDAEKRAAALLHDAEVRAARLREESEGLMARRVDEAETAGASIRQAAEAELRAARDKARAEAESTVAAAQAQGREMVAEARAVRERMLSDLTRRRRAAQLQIDQLRAGRERLLAAYEVVRRTLDDATRELETAEPEARLAAEEVGRRAVESDIAVRPEGTGSTWPAGPAAAPPPPSPTSQRPAEPAAAPPAPEPVGPAPATPARRLAPVPPATAPDRSEAPRRVATLDPPRPPALRPQSVADAAPARLRAVTASTATDPDVTAPVAEPERQEPPVADLGTGQHPIVPPAPARDVEGLFARIRQEVPPPVPQPEAAPEASPVADVPAGLDDDVTDENALARRDELLDPVETELTRALKRVLQDEQNEVLDRLRRTRTTAAEAVLPDPTAQSGRYAAAATPFLERASAAGSGSPGTEEGARAAGETAAALARDLVEPLRSRLEQVLANANGDRDEGGLFDSVSSVYRQWKVQQIEPVARHAAAAAFTSGRFGATPDGTPLRWLVDDEGGRCPDCDDNALAGAVAKGEAFPTGQAHPPAHPGCRCLLIASLP